MSAPPSGGRLLVWLAPAWLVSAWLILRAEWFWSEKPELQFGYIVVLLCGYLFYEAWETRPEPRPAWSIASGIAAAAGLGVLFLTQLYQAAYGLTPASMSGLALGMLAVVFANLRVVFGWGGVRHFGFAFAFLLVAMPIPSVIEAPLVGGLQTLIASLNVELLNLLGIPAQRVGSLVHLPSGTVGVDEACSGIRSLQSALMATLFIGYLTLRSNVLRVVLFGGGVGIAVLGNILRSFYLSHTASVKGVDSIAAVHDAAGWSILLFTAIGVGIVAWFLGRLEKATAAVASRTSPPAPA